MTHTSVVVINLKKRVIQTNVKINSISSGIESIFDGNNIYIMFIYIEIFWLYLIGHWCRVTSILNDVENKSAAKMVVLTPYAEGIGINSYVNDCVIA